MDIDSGFSTGQVGMSNVPKMIRILAADDHPLLRKGLAAVVNAEPDMKLVAEASNGRRYRKVSNALPGCGPDGSLMRKTLPLSVSARDSKRSRVLAATRNTILEELPLHLVSG